MEPVTYFVTYGTAMGCYAYFVLTKQVSLAFEFTDYTINTTRPLQEYILPDVKDRQHLIDLHKTANKSGLDLNEYNELKREVAEIEQDLRRLHDPLYKNLPAFPPKTPNFSQTEIASSKKLKALLSEAKLLKAGGKASLEKISNILESATKRLKK